MRIDEKGRISIPSDIRRSLGLVPGSEVKLGFSLAEGLVFILAENGQDSAKDSTRCCRPLRPDPNPDPEYEKLIRCKNVMAR